MTATEFLQKPGEYTSANLYFICGGERYLTDTVLSRLIDALGADEMNTDFLADMSSFSTACAQYPCFSDTRVVVVKDCELFFKGEPKQVISELSNLMPSTKVIFALHAETGKKREGAVNTDKRRALYKHLIKNALVIDTSALSSADLERWVVSTGKKNSLKLNRAQAEEIINICGKDMYILQNEIAKLSFLGEYSRDKILDIGSATAEFNSFAFHDLMIQGQIDEAQELLTKIFTELKSYIPVIANIASKFRLMYLAKSYSSPQQLASVAGVHEYPAKLAIGQARSYSKTALSHAISALAEYDLALKSGGIALPMMAFCNLIYYETKFIPKRILFFTYYKKTLAFSQNCSKM